MNEAQRRRAGGAQFAPPAGRLEREVRRPACECSNFEGPPAQVTAPFHVEYAYARLRLHTRSPSRLRGRLTTATSPCLEKSG
jgi:hypothetical protein